MNKSYIYVRGQVWYWEDPIYGRKERNESISSWDASVRFSRYVIVVQSTETINPLSVLAIPCSSGNKTAFDVQVPLSHSTVHTDITYARTSLIFPAHPKCLQRYICTLSDSIMEIIEDNILKLLAPSVANLITLEDLEVIDEDKDKDKEQEQSIETPEPEDPKQFRQSKWNDEKIASFLSLYKEGGMDAVCKAFNLKEGSVKKYYTQWSKQEIASTVEPDIDKTEIVKVPEIAAATTTAVSVNRFDNIKITNNKESPYAVSKVSNLIKDALFQLSLINEVKPYFKDGVTIINDDFYKDLSSSIYYSLLDFLDIKKEYGVFVIPKVTPDYFNINTWEFLNHVYYDARISSITNGERMIEAYRNYYKDPSYGIDREWIGVFRNRISTRLKISEFGINIICGKIQKLFCRKN